MKKKMGLGPIGRNTWPAPMKTTAHRQWVPDPDPAAEFQKQLVDAIPLVKDTIQMRGKGHKGIGNVTVIKLLQEYAEELRLELGLTQCVTEPIMMEVLKELDDYSGYDDSFIVESKEQDGEDSNH